MPKKTEAAAQIDPELTTKEAKAENKRWYAQHRAKQKKAKVAHRKGAR